MVDDFSDTELPDVFNDMSSSVQTSYLVLFPILCCQLVKCGWKRNYAIILP